MKLYSTLCNLKVNNYYTCFWILYFISNFTSIFHFISSPFAVCYIGVQGQWKCRFCLFETFAGFMINLFRRFCSYSKVTKILILCIPNVPKWIRFIHVFTHTIFSHFITRCTTCTAVAKYSYSYLQIRGFSVILEIVKFCWFQFL